MTTPPETGDAPLREDIDRGDTGREDVGREDVGREGARRDLGDLLLADEGDLPLPADLPLPETPPQPASGLIERAGKRLSEDTPAAPTEHAKSGDIEPTADGGKR